jgi:hypothetical protein
MISLFEIHNYLSNKGIDIWAVKQDNGMYRCQVYESDKFQVDSSFEYATHQEARDETARKIYKHLTK